MGECSANPTDPHHTPTIIQPSTSQPQKKQKPRRTKRKDTEVPQPSGPTTNVADEAVYEEIDDSLERAATTATSLDVEQDSGNINKTQPKATPKEASSPGTCSGGGPSRQETIGDTIAHTRSENVTKDFNDPMLTRGNTLRSGGDSLKLQELIELCTNLKQRVLDLETTKTTQGNEFASLKRRVKKLERRNKSRTHKLQRLHKVGLSRRVEYSNEEGLGEEDASKQGRISDIDADAGINYFQVSKATKSPTIVDYKIYKEGRKAIFKLSKQMSIVKAVFKKTEPVNYMDNFLLLNLRTMLEHHVEDTSIPYYMLVEKMYPLTKHTLHYMFNDVKLQVDYECKMAFELLRLVKK
ncbi:hypothetical protein Tco_0920065 [Tanacetum coccineum]